MFKPLEPGRSRFLLWLEVVGLLCFTTRKTAQTMRGFFISNQFKRRLVVRLGFAAARDNARCWGYCHLPPAAPTLRCH